jgi:hypothetical protein
MNTLAPSAIQRRGVLLLVVLSMLTLFLLLGTAYLVVSTRSRVTARAFSRLVMQSEDVRVPSEVYLDRTLAHVIRGGTSTPLLPNPAVPAAFESLLEDKYGSNSTLAGIARGVTAASGTSLGAVLTLTNVTLVSSTTGTAAPPPFPKAAELSGRVLSLCPDDGEVTSHRILQASGSGTGPFTLRVDVPLSTRPFRLPGANCRVVVNGREFDGRGTTNEPWDAFDGDNPFLARVEPSGTNVAASGTGPRMSFTISNTTTIPSTPAEWADSDNDGQPDSVFLDFHLPSVPAASGTLEFHAAVLVVDLDSRFNVNAHGSLASRLYPAGASWPTVSGTTLADVPLGSGYGPPEANIAWMYPQQAGSSGTAGYPPNRQRRGEDNALWLMAGSTNAMGSRPTTSRFTLSSTTPSLQSLQGRYGERVGSLPSIPLATSANASTASSAGDSLPGAAAVDDLLSRIGDQRSPPSRNGFGTWSVVSASTGVPSTWWNGSTTFNWSGFRTAYNSPPDLHGRMKTVAVSSTASPAGSLGPRLVFAKPEWGDGETKDDPYEMLLASAAPRNGWMADPNTNGFRLVYDNVYTNAELEPVLRPYDADTFRLPMRLAATLGSLAEESRLRVTTSSWDTTAITGTAAANLATWLNSITGTVSGTSATSGILGGEVARGERFDLNRPLTSVKPAAYNAAHPYYVQRQAYFKDLYTLLCAILHPTSAPPPAKVKEYAQWAANVVEFRDADSTMTPFEYDTNPLNGWGVDGDASGTAGDLERDMVWGVERPELLIMETSAWEDASTGELFVTLHRPWNAHAVSTSGSIAAEPCDTLLDVTGTPQNRVNLGRLSGTSSFPIWRLRIVDEIGGGGSAFVRFDPNGAAATPDFNASSITSANAAPTMAADSWLCVFGQNSLGARITTSSTVGIDQGGSGTFRVPGSVGAPNANRRAMVYLERLTDPAASISGTTWTSSSGTSVPHYHVVDQAPIEVVNRTIIPGATPPPPSVIRRDVATPGQALWRCLPLSGGTPSPSTPVQLGPGSFPAATSKAEWFFWPNRPFISSAELLLVPGIPDAGVADIVSGSNAVGMLKHYHAWSSGSNALRGLHSGTNQLLLLDAVHVPTRFAGIHRTITSDPSGGLVQAGIHSVTTPVNQISAYREPGRINVNTITADDVWNTVIAGPLASGTGAGASPGGTGATPEALPLKTRTSANDDTQGAAASGTSAADFVTKPARSLGEVLTLTGSAPQPLNVATDTHPALKDSLNPASRLYTVTRLANTATVRSNVFAVWITLRERIPGDPDSVKYHRAFYIVDRSIPVAHEAGKDHNVWDAVVLRRIIE